MSSCATSALNLILAPSPLYKQAKHTKPSLPSQATLIVPSRNVFSNYNILQSTISYIHMSASSQKICIEAKNRTLHLMKMKIYQHFSIIYKDPLLCSVTFMFDVLSLATIISTTNILLTPPNGERQDTFLH